MDIRDRKALAFSALQRLWVAYEPAYAENQWQKAFAFAALPEEQRTPGHWYRYQQDERGFIECGATGDEGAFHTELPSGIDPGSVIVVVRQEGFPSLFDRMKALIFEVEQDPGPGLHLLLEEMEELRGPSHTGRMKVEIASGGREALHGGIHELAGFLDSKLQQLSTEGLNRNRVTGVEVAALMLMTALVRNLADAVPPPPSNLLYKLFDPSGVLSLDEMTVRFIGDCFQAGMGEAACAALDQIRKGGDATLAIARDLQPGDMHPGLYLDSYYACLQQAGIRFLAARWGWLGAVMSAGREDGARGRFEKRGNAAEEKFVRTNMALLYAVQDLDGSRYREKQRAIREAREAGMPAQAEAVLFNVFDSQMFYPKALRDVLSENA
jgi:hypothetical protein